MLSTSSQLAYRGGDTECRARTPAAPVFHACAHEARTSVGGIPPNVHGTTPLVHGSAPRSAISFAPLFSTPPTDTGARTAWTSALALDLGHAVCGAP